MFRLSYLLIIILIIFKTDNLYSQIVIKYKIGDEIITNIDVINEKNYLIFLRPKLKNLSEEELNKISENSLIRDIIKKKELDKVFKNLKKQDITKTIKKNLFDFKRVKSEEEFIKLLDKNDLDYDVILEKVKYEGLWNELIFRKFKGLVKINKIQLKEKLIAQMSKNKKYEYNISEILFDLDNDVAYQEKYTEIINYINLYDFKSAVSKYSIANSVNNNGQIGWIKETLLSEELVNILRKLKIGQLTDPIKSPSGYLILKLNDSKEMKQVVSIEKELEERIKFEQNKQLNQYSLLYFKKLKQNTKINEY